MDGRTLEDEYLDPCDSSVEDLVSLVPIEYEGKETAAGALAKIQLDNTPKAYPVVVSCTTPEGSALGSPEKLAISAGRVETLDFPAPAAIDVPVTVTVSCGVETSADVDTGYEATDVTTFRVRVLPNRLCVLNTSNAAQSTFSVVEKAGLQTNLVRLGLAEDAFQVDTSEESMDDASVVVVCAATSPNPKIDVDETQKEGITLSTKASTVALSLTNPGDVTSDTAFLIVCSPAGTQGGMKDVDTVAFTVIVTPVRLAAVGGPEAYIASFEVISGGGDAVAVGSLSVPLGAGSLVRLSASQVTTAMTVDCLSGNAALPDITGVQVPAGANIVSNLVVPAANLVDQVTTVTYTCKSTDSATSFYAESVAFDVVVWPRAIALRYGSGARAADDLADLPDGELVAEAIVVDSQGTVSSPVQVTLVVWPEESVTVECTTMSPAIAESSQTVSVTIASPADRSWATGTIASITAAAVTDSTDAVFTCSVPCFASGYTDAEMFEETFTVTVLPPAFLAISGSDQATVPSSVNVAALARVGRPPPRVYRHRELVQLHRNRHGGHPSSRRDPRVLTWCSSALPTTPASLCRASRSGRTTTCWVRAGPWIWAQSRSTQPWSPQARR